MPKTIQDAIGSVALQTEYGLVGGFNLKLDETVVPVVLMKDLSQPASNWRDCYFGDARGAAGALNQHKWALLNPVGSGILVELYEVTFCSSTAGCDWEVVVTPTPYVPGTVLNGAYQDTNTQYLVPGSVPAATPLWAATAAATPGDVVLAFVALIAQPFVWHPKCLLWPGQQIIFHQLPVNNNGQLSMQWRERPVKITER